jgi:hypothetical protein
VSSSLPCARCTAVALHSLHGCYWSHPHSTHSLVVTLLTHIARSHSLLTYTALGFDCSYRSTVCVTTVSTRLSHLPCELPAAACRCAYVRRPSSITPLLRRPCEHVGRSTLLGARELTKLPGPTAVLTYGRDIVRQRHSICKPKDKDQIGTTQCSWYNSKPCTARGSTLN